MISLSAYSARPAQQLILGFPSRAQIPTINFAEVFPLTSPTSSLKLRFNGTARLQVQRKLSTVYAASSNSMGGKSPNEESSVAETSNAGQGPPFVTILAGFLVFFLVCWIIGSIIMWLIGLIVNVAPK